MLFLLLACVAPPEEPVRPSVLLLTDVAVEVPGARAVERLPSSGAERTVLATLLTGRVPREHGVLDPVVHAPAVPTVGELLASADWTVHAMPQPLLHPGEQWMPHQGSSADFLWGDALVEADIVIAVDAERVQWRGTGSEDLPDAMATVDVVPTLLAVLGVEAETDGRDVRGTTSTALAGDPASTPFGAGVHVDGQVLRARRIGHDVAPGWTAVREARGRGQWTGDPHQPTSDTVLPERIVAPVVQALQQGRTRQALEHLATLEGRIGVSVASERWRNDILLVRSGPVVALEHLEDVADRYPSAQLSLEIAQRWADLGQSSKVLRWTGPLVVGWSDHLVAHALAGRHGEEASAFWASSGDDGLLARWLVEGALDRGEPVEDAWLDDLRPDRESALLMARVAWSRGASFAAVREVDSVLAEDPFFVPARLWRARWALDLGEPIVAERLLAPLARLGLQGDVADLHREAVARGEEERARLQALRASWRNQP